MTNYLEFEAYIKSLKNKPISKPIYQVSQFLTITTKYVWHFTCFTFGLLVSHYLLILLLLTGCATEQSDSLEYNALRKELNICKINEVIYKKELEKCEASNLHTK
jgi:hypothetical protein